MHFAKLNKTVKNYTVGENYSRHMIINTRSKIKVNSNHSTESRLTVVSRVKN